MTREDAINILYGIRADNLNLNDAYTKDKYDALDIVIKLLEQEPCEDWYDVPSNEMTLEQARKAVKDLRKKLAEYLEQEPCRKADDYENEISELHNRLDIAEYDKERLKEKVTTLEEKLKGLSTEPCEDAISRQAVINGIDNYIEKVQSTGAKDDFISFEELVVKALPPVTPQQKTGRWIDAESLDSALWYACSECGETEFHATNYCPNCGAKMESATETWKGYHRNITAPEGTFDKIFNEANEEDDDI